MSVRKLRQGPHISTFWGLQTVPSSESLLSRSLNCLSNSIQLRRELDAAGEALKAVVVLRVVKAVPSKKLLLSQRLNGLSISMVLRVVKAYTMLSTQCF